MVYHQLIRSILVIGVGLFLHGCDSQDEFQVAEDDETVTLTTDHYRLHVTKNGFRYQFEGAEGNVIAPAHPESGLQIGTDSESLAPVTSAALEETTGSEAVFSVQTGSGLQAEVRVHAEPHFVRFAVRPEEDGPEEEGRYTITGRTGGVSPAYGLADHAAFGGGAWDEGGRSKTELTGFEMAPLRGYRMISNFVVFPQHGFAEVNMEPGDKVVRLTETENVQGAQGVRSMPSLYYFVGSPEQIYQSFLEVRNREGYPVMKPKYEWFGVGWEAFGALAWNTSQETVTENINEYLDLGFPLEWMVIGSGFWPSGEGEFDEHGTPYDAEVQSEESKALLATTSFGLWDEQKYPDPEGMIEAFHEQGLKLTIGLRNGFIPGGPFTDEGLKNGYFMTDENGEPELFSVGFPESDVYLLDAEKPDAVDWYVSLWQRWADYGIDGYKEDLFGYPQTLPDDFVNPINEAMMDRGVYVMGRNNYLGSPVDIHRYNDFNYNQPQDRGPINGLAYTYSGFPYVYPDIVGGTGLATGRFGDESQEQLAVYLMRYVEYAALNPSMSFGYGPWNFDEEVVEVTREAAMLHDRLQPYIYSNAVKAAETGFPHPMTPLPLAYPDDPGVYGLADTTRRSYQWLIGESLLATPLYGDDYATAERRDVYLPEGTWMEYDSGEVHEGPTTLEDYPLPVGKTPLFVGGPGIVVEEIDGELKGRLYPVAEEGETLFYDRDGETQSIITVAGPDWEDPTVIDQTTGEEVPGTWNRHAYEFTLTPGRDYRVE